MGFWKILGYTIAGTSTGIAFVVALPVAGPVGAITGLGALIAGGAGAAAGGALSNIDPDDKKSEKKGYQNGVRKEQARWAQKYDELKNLLRRCIEKMQEQKEFDEFSIALYAVAFSVANCDGELHPSEIQEIEEFISGVSFKKLPASLKAEIMKMKGNPPNFNTAMEYVKTVGVEDWKIIDLVIKLAMNADGIVREQEKAYLKAWKVFKMTA